MGLFDRFRKKNNEAPKEDLPSQIPVKEEKLPFQDMKEMFLSRTGSFYAAMEDPALRFPHLDIRGDAMMFFDRQTGETDREISEHNGNGTFYLREFSAMEAVSFLQELIGYGIVKVLVHYGARREYLQVKELAPDRDVLVPDINNRSMRMMFMREMELSDRLRKLDDTKRILPGGKKMYETMLTLRFNAYRDMGHAVLYVGAVPEKSVKGAFYTQAALKAATQRRDAMRENSPLVSLCYPGYSEASVYPFPLRLSTAKVMDSRRVLPVFSDYKGAEKFVNDLLPLGTKAAVVAVTFAEMMGQAYQCDGIMLDMFGFGRILFKEDFPEIVRWAACEMPIIVNIKEKNAENARTDVTVNSVAGDIGKAADVTARYTGKSREEAEELLSHLPAVIRIESSDKDAFIRRMAEAGCRVVTKEPKSGMLRTVVIRSLGDDRIRAAAIIRKYTGCTPEEARALTENLPGEIESPMALKIADELTAAGCDVLVKE